MLCIRINRKQIYSEIYSIWWNYTYNCLAFNDDLIVILNFYVFHYF
ncbi:hypothetical protein X975_12259, partial [Stegodyphus mimosarum]